MAPGRAQLTVLGRAAAGVVVDQAAKAWAVAQLKGRPPVELIGETSRPVPGGPGPARLLSLQPHRR